MGCRKHQGGGSWDDCADCCLCGYGTLLQVPVCIVHYWDFLPGPLARKTPRQCFWHCGEASLFYQRSRSWDIANHRYGFSRSVDAHHCCYLLLCMAAFSPIRNDTADFV
jgi:hypothetical protein